MKLGLIGLGKMGQNIAMHLLNQGIDVGVYNRTGAVTEAFKSQVSSSDDQKGQISFTYTIPELVKNLPQPRTFFIMVKAGPPVEDVITGLVQAGATTGDIIIDGGNSFYKDSVGRYNKLKAKGINFIDCGTSGGLAGARHGACLMVGGDKEAVMGLADLWNAIAVKDGWAYMGKAGAGHFVKMVHNGIEYGIDQALGEGMAVLGSGPYRLDLAKVAAVWSHGSVIRGWLTELLARALTKDPHLESLTGQVGGGQTGRWMMEAAKELDLATEILAAALEARQKSHLHPTFATKVVSALRREYGGHDEYPNPVNMPAGQAGTTGGSSSSPTALDESGDPSAGGQTHEP